MAKALGKGLGDILSDVGEAYEKEFSGLSPLELQERGVAIARIEVDKIRPNPFQPRKHFDPNALQELSESIKTHGLIQPIVVTQTKDGYMLIAGERRLRAHKLVGIDTIDAIVIEIKQELRMRELALIENIQREALNPLETAYAYAELIKIHRITQDRLSQIVHKSRSQIANTLRLLQLGEYAKEKIASGELSQGHAKILVGLDEKRQRIMVDTIIGQKLTVREAEVLVRSNKSKPTRSTFKKSDSIFQKSTVEQLKVLLPFSFFVKKNRLTIDFKSKQELEDFVKMLKKEHL